MSYQWKHAGDYCGYRWIRKYRGVPKKCPKCGGKTNIQMVVPHDPFDKASRDIMRLFPKTVATPEGLIDVAFIDDMANQNMEHEDIYDPTTEPEDDEY